MQIENGPQPGHSAMNLVELLQIRAERSPHKVPFTFWPESKTTQGRVTFQMLDHRGRAIAARLQALKIRGPAMLFYNAGPEFIEAFWGCLYAGVIAVPAPVLRSRRQADPAKAIIADSGATIALTTSRLIARARDQGGGNDLAWMATDEVESSLADEYLGQSLDPHGVAYLQYTSGSTSAPKGVMIAHANVLHNLDYIAESFRHSSESVSVNWLPHFHDMGLVYGILAPVHGGFSSIQMAPATFLQCPAAWLQAISVFGATHSGGPNFAYDLCVQRVNQEECREMDLGRWRVAFNGAETVRWESLKQFAGKFESCGFQLEAFYPAYGLAEATLKVACKADGRRLKIHRLVQSDQGTGLNTSENAAKDVVSCGHPGSAVTVVIVDPQSCTPLPTNEIGEIWVSGASVASGYWHRPAETAATFQSSLPMFPGQQFLRTGDLGFVQNGELFVTGRLKDLIIIRGENHYPEDIERTAAQCHPAVRLGCCVAFSLEVEGEERLIVVCEIERSNRESSMEVIKAIRDAVVLEHGIQIYAAVLVKPASIPKTSSGKVQRGYCCDQYLSGTLKSVASHVLDMKPAGLVLHHENHGIVAEQLFRMVGAVLHLDPAHMDPGQALTTMGLDSLSAAELVSRIRKCWNLELSIADLLEGMSSHGLIQRIEQHESSGTAAPEFPQVANESEFPATLEQERMWSLDRRSPGRTEFNISVAMEFKGKLDFHTVSCSLKRAFDRHPCLRTSFQKINGRLLQFSSAKVSLEVELTDISDELDPAAKAIAETQSERNRPFDLCSAPLLRARLLRLGLEDHVLLLTAHHIIVDAHSMMILANEIAQECAAAPCGWNSPAKKKGASFADYALWQRSQWGQNPFEEELNYWRQALANLPPPIDWVGSGKLQHSESISPNPWLSWDLPESFLAKLRLTCRGEGATPFMWYLAALKAALFCFTSQQDILVGTPVRGRTWEQFEEVIGFFAHPIVVRTHVNTDDSFRDLLVRIRKAALSAYRHQEVPFVKIIDAARPRRFANRATLFQVMFTLIEVPSLLAKSNSLMVRLLDIPPGTQDLELVVSVVERPTGAKVWFQYDQRLFGRETVEQLLSSFHQILTESMAQPAIQLRRFERFRNRHELPRMIAIAATFRADPIERHLRFWLKNLRIASDIEFASYNQIFQELLTPGSILMRNRAGFNVLLLRFEDWEDRSNTSVDISALQVKIDQLKQLLQEAGEKSVAPFVVQICPVSRPFMDRLGGTQVFAEIERYASRELGCLGNVHVITAFELMDLYPVEDYYDKYCDENGQMPFTAALFASLGAMTARMLYSLTRPPRKVIVLDCDGTLWGGVCGEDGPQGVQIDEHRRYVQDFMIQQASAGMLLCLCSKNNEPDVWEVFQSRSEMKLSREHLVAWRINWEPKSENLKSLAKELSLGLDSFIFIDDAAAECHEVKLECPEAITIQIPAEGKEVPRFLKHLWALDHWKMTEEDRQRLTLYREHQIREKTRSEKPTLESFIQSLKLEVEIRPANKDHFDRISQLTLRTNQFNLTMRRRSASEIQNLARSGYRILAVTAKDRFGDYGIVGLMILLHKSNTLMVDTFLLSCRALGRNIELTMFDTIVQLAREHGAVTIDVEYVEGKRNSLALAFLDRMKPLSKSVNGLVTSFQFSTLAKEYQCTGCSVRENTWLALNTNSE